MVRRIPDAAAATQLWDGRERVSRIVCGTGRRDLRLTVNYHDDCAAVGDYDPPRTFLGAFPYPPGHRHRPCVLQESRHATGPARRPPRRDGGRRAAPMFLPGRWAS
ncbi:hypothetical protein FraEuI1c_5687 [Pseudofrankia inefficax]|uniref:Uncharacterized protein n=1 Tax=Pseudofrankia inefficax (strain DSM 45817 / CECT 9037 / DDB 130130 / EuI1c) TaxID=298654 RepID=E3IUI6_PSEI1|nr:hypothetical protein FraEuI1c_5687 [Pseudofrankia inefficax]